MQSYEEEWLAGQPILRAILHCVGLFDRPASGDCLEALRAKPPILGLTDEIVKLDERGWRRNIARLREVRLLAPADPTDPEALDAHPLVREWFGDRLRQTNEAAWKAAHSRLYDHLRRTTREGFAPTLHDLAPLYHAVGHGCLAGRQQDALEKVYINRICRWQVDGVPEFYSFKRLGAVSSDLAALSWFFDRPYETPASVFGPLHQSWLLSEAGARLRAHGRLPEALAAMRTGLQMTDGAGSWRNTAAAASNLSQTELLIGEVAAALAAAETAVELADRSADTFLMVDNRVHRAVVLHAAGQWAKAADLFADAARQQPKSEPATHCSTRLGVIITASCCCRRVGPTTRENT